MNNETNRIIGSIEAVELFSAGWCNLDCVYCYIPKNDEFLHKFHSEIIRKIIGGDFLNEIKQIYGNNITAITHWGTEPSLTINLFKKFYLDAITEFPKLSKIGMSSNFISGYDFVLKFIKNFPKKEGISFDIQISLDGPKWMTDKNRKGGATDKIVSNIILFFKGLSDIDLNKNSVKLHFKPTATKEDHLKLARTENLLDEYYIFFDDLISKLVPFIKPNIYLSYECSPTIVVPQPFTQEDGIIFNELFQKQLELKNSKKYKFVIPNSSYYTRFFSREFALKELYTKPKMFSCSAGNSCLSLNENQEISPCHRLFYLNDPDYINVVKKCGNKDVTQKDSEKIKAFKNSYIRNINDKVGIANLMYKTRGYNDFIKLKHNVYTAMARLLANSGQISPCYKNYKNSELLALYTMITMSCPMEHVLSSGSIHIPNSSLLKLFGNGFLENCISEKLKKRT